ncbi:HAD family hydrolase [Polymorphobacter fuscus]|uniref:HAD-IA family hydrolase n=1 Tax=Sandarakinorhabdus fusca TaxID=1439888 RepID=A0A7C9KVP9_9SPHN|nr:HAD family hydrolase [Polymorphobacter fuscus]KAB7648805.1 HAD family hydrolase [Polymorphobacter fuscus]MQT16385.1 HAD-IA family hydrolase [Polymorphobacter fuscus]NJC07326.1 membrane protein [Polymorphobacter fuscus]
MQIKAVLFDIDGTLVDSNDLHVLAWEAAFEGIGARFDRQQVHDQIGKGTDMLVPTLLPDLDDAAVERLGDAHGAVFKARYLETVQPFPQARALLAHAKGLGQTVVLASSASKSEVEHYLDLLDARDLVAVTTSSDDVERTKPAPDIFATALARLAGVEPEQVIVVGDTPYDVEAAAGCGIRTVALRSGGFADDVLRAAGAVEIHDDVAALLAGYAGSVLGQ